MPFCAGGMGCVNRPGTRVSLQPGLVAQGIHHRVPALALGATKVNASEGKYGSNVRSFSPQQRGYDGSRCLYPT